MNTENYKEDSRYEELARKYPELIQKSKFDDIDLGEGWFGIIDVLFGLFCAKLNTVSSSAKYFAKADPLADITPLLVRVEQATDELPVIIQIKNKFGGLRIYLENPTDEYQAYIDFAEEMASKTCCMCGSPGERRIGSTLCDVHYHAAMAEESHVK